MLLMIIRIFRTKIIRRETLNQEMRPFNQIVRFRLICLFGFVLVIFISFESSHYFKCPSCSISSVSSVRETLYKVLNNTEDEQTSLDDTSIWCLSMAHRLDVEQRFTEKPHLRAPPMNSTRLHRLPYRYSQWQNSSRLPRSITPCEHHLHIRLLMIIERICRKHKITFFLIYGSLLGSWRHHDMIPWDDDIDIMISAKEKDRFYDVVKRMNATLIQSYIFNRDRKEYYKIYLKNTPLAGRRPWNFPFADIFLYERNDTYLWRVPDRDLDFKVTDIFPLTLRPFGELWLPSPRKPDRLFSFDPYDMCKGHIWNHKNEVEISSVSVKCDELKHIYPFVERNNKSNTTEVLRTNDTIIHTIDFN